MGAARKVKGSKAHQELALRLVHLGLVIIGQHRSEQKCWYHLHCDHHQVGKSEGGDGRQGRGRRSEGRGWRKFSGSLIALS